MWDKKRTDVPVPQSPVASPTDTFLRQPAGTATIGRAVRIIGDVYSEEDLFIDGEVEGTLEVKGSKVTIGPNGKAKSDVQAREVLIQGQVTGNVEATQKITIRKDGSLVGNIKTAGIVIDDDAYFKGSIDIVRTAGAARAG